MNSPAATEVRSAKKAVLVVDDEFGPRESLRMILKPLYEVHTASDGYEALRAINERKFDVVTLDLKMPGLSGIDVLKEIKKLRPETEVIIITGYGSLENASEAVRWGTGDFLSKPFNVADVLSTVARSFERRDHGRQLRSLLENS